MTVKIGAIGFLKHSASRIAFAHLYALSHDDDKNRHGHLP
jgi:hypothetical protein